MNLREKLKLILPDILPVNPAESTKGTELIRLVKMRLNQEYSDATLRYHFSIMCCDPASPIAKVEQGQGYYMRTSASNHAANRGLITPYQARLGLTFENQPEVVDLAVARQQKLRAIYHRLAETAGKFPFIFESSFGAEAPYENIWKCPDAAVVDWEMGEHMDGNFAIAPALLGFKRHLSLPLFNVTSVKLKLEISYDSFREDFFQSLSNASWAHQGELVICAPIPDEQMVEDLRRLGSEYGIAISSLGLALDTLDEIPPHWAIAKMSEREFESLHDRLQIQKFTTTGQPKSFNWRTLERVRQDNADFEALLGWLNRSLSDKRAYTYEQYASMVGQELIKNDA